MDSFMTHTSHSVKPNPLPQSTLKKHLNIYCQVTSKAPKPFLRHVAKSIPTTLRAATEACYDGHMVLNNPIRSGSDTACP